MRPPVKIGVTIASSAVSSNLTDFPVLVQLGDLSSKFWAKVKDDGGDIRVKNSSDVIIPHDLVAIDKANKRGILFLKTSLSSSANTTIYITCGDPSLSELSASDTNGRNAVWSDYHRVYVFNENLDRTGNGSAMTLPHSFSSFMKYSKGTDLDFHQGVAWDGTYYYMVDTDELVKYDVNWNEIARNSTPLASTGIAGVNHCGDPEVVNGLLYVPVEEYPNSPYDNQHIGVFNATTLAFVTSYDISAQGREISGFAYNTADGYLYVTDYTIGSSVMKYTLTGQYIGTLSLTSTRSAIQGMTFWNGYIYIQDDGDDTTHKYQTDGTYVGKVYTSYYGGNWEGITHNDTGILCLVDQTGGVGGVYELRPAEEVYYGSLGFNGAGSAYASCSQFTSWTMGCSAVMSDISTAAHHGTLMYGPSGADATQDAGKTGIIYRINTDIHWGFWNQSNGWLMQSGTVPATDQLYRLAATQNGTTSRKLYVDGVEYIKSESLSQRPTGADSHLWIGGSRRASNNEPFRGAINYVYLRNGVLSAAWLAAEASNWNNPSAFYSSAVVEG